MELGEGLFRAIVHGPSTRGTPPSEGNAAGRILVRHKKGGTGKRGSGDMCLDIVHMRLAQMLLSDVRLGNNPIPSKSAS